MFQTVPARNGESDSPDKMPDSPAKTLVYLDSNCARERIYYLTFMLQEVNSDPNSDPKDSQNAAEEESPDLSPTGILKGIAEDCHLDRLTRIIKDALNS